MNVIFFNVYFIAFVVTSVFIAVTFARFGISRLARKNKIVQFIAYETLFTVGLAVAFMASILGIKLLGAGWSGLAMNMYGMAVATILIFMNATVLGYSLSRTPAFRYNRFNIAFLILSTLLVFYAVYLYY